MQDYQRQFIQLATSHNALRFGEFTLKSGRVSPYFFNAGIFNSGSVLAKLGEFYARALLDANINVDMLFGPAYKGIPLVTTTATALADKFSQDYPICFNRKEAKTHGEGGNLVGAPLNGDVLIIDDVITAGTAIREALDLIQSAGARPAGVLIGLDRQEKGQTDRSAIQELEQAYQIPVISIIKLEHIITYLDEQNQSELLGNMQIYREAYGV